MRPPTPNRARPAWGAALGALAGAVLLVSATGAAPRTSRQPIMAVQCPDSVTAGDAELLKPLKPSKLQNADCFTNDRMR